MSFGDEPTSLPPAAPAPPVSGEPETPGEQKHPGLARLFIFAALAMFVLMMGLILYRWMTVPEPTAYLLVVGEESDSGTVVNVSEVGLSDFTGVLSRDNSFVARFPLPASDYKVKVTKNDQRVWEGEVILREASGMRLDLSELRKQQEEYKKQLALKKAAATQQ